jgi:Phage integrase family
VSAGVRRRFAPHQMRDARAAEMAREGVALNVIQRQLGHANLGITSISLNGSSAARSSIPSTDDPLRCSQPAPDSANGGRPEQHSRTWVELMVFTDGLDEGSARMPAASGGRAAHAAAGRASMKATNPAGSRVVLLGCVKTKLGHRARAKDLYISQLWRGRRAYAEASGYPWLILSAKHGLLDPDQKIAPYDVALAHLTADARRRWGQRVITDGQDSYRLAQATAGKGVMPLI